jgi:hypothetical protein
MIKKDEEHELLRFKEGEEHELLRFKRVKNMSC